MGQFDTLLKCSIGHTSFTLLDYSARIEPIAEAVTSGPGAGTGETRRGRRYTLVGEGYITGTSASNFAANLTAALSAMRTSGQNVVIYGLGGHKEFEILAAWAVDGGPHVAVELQRQSGSESSGLRRNLRFTVTADTIGGDEGGGGGGDEDQVSDSYRVRTIQRPDLLLSISRSGELRGVNLAGYFDSTTAAQFKAAYPHPNWVVELRKEAEGTDGKIRYELVATQLANPLPTGAGYTVRDGTYAERKDGETSWRLVRTFTWDLLVTGDAWALERDVRPQLAAHQVFLRESIEVTGLREQRLRAIYTVLSSTHPTGWLLSFEQSMDIPREVHPRIGREFDGGGSPLIHYGPAPVYRYVQRGRAVGLGVIPAPPQPLLGVAAYGRQPRIVPRSINAYEWEITWEYEFLLAAPQVIDVVALQVHPASAYLGGT